MVVVVIISLFVIIAAIGFKFAKEGSTLSDILTWVYSSGILILVVIAVSISS